MNKNLFNLFMICLLLTTIFFIIYCSNEVIESVNFSISIWKDNLFPTLFPFFVISNLLMNYGFVDIIGNLLSKPMQKYFSLPGCCGFVLAASLFSGFPSGAKYTSDLIKQGKITQEEGNRLLTFTHYSNPLFIIGMIGSILLNHQQVAYIILTSHILSGLLVGILLSRRKEKEILLKSKKVWLTSIKELKKPNKSFGELLTNSIWDSLNTLFLLLGIVTIFLIITTILNQIIHLPSILHAIISGILEMTQGIKLTSYLPISEFSKTILITGIISFGGFSVHLQVLGIISNQKIKYKPFLLARILHSIFAMGFVSILYTIFFLS